jgi:hypothetical protein
MADLPVGPAMVSAPRHDMELEIAGRLTAHVDFAGVHRLDERLRIATIRV